jgi:hypothetical protein
LAGERLLAAYNAGWLAEMPFGQHPVWEEIAAIHAEEGMGGCPGWAAEIVERMMELPCAVIGDSRRPFADMRTRYGRGGVLSW